MAADKQVNCTFFKTFGNPRGVSRGMPTNVGNPNPDSFTNESLMLWEPTFCCRIVDIPINGAKYS